MKHVEDLAVLMGAANVETVGKDDKSHIPLGIPAANKKSPILMMMEYPFTLPDHIFVVATKHKLIPSVYTLQEIKDDTLLYSGPTYASVGFLKHDKVDELAEFEHFLKNGDDLKPIWIFTRYGHSGP